jgi:hypothetical protein
VSPSLKTPNAALHRLRSPGVSRARCSCVQAVLLGDENVCRNLQTSIYPEARDNLASGAPSSAVTIQQIR